jgi:hypothetical protein
MPFVDAEEAAEEESATRRSGWSPLALIWLLLFVGGTIYRSCAGE